MIGLLNELGVAAVEEIIRRHAWTCETRASASSLRCTEREFTGVGFHASVRFEGGEFRLLEPVRDARPTLIVKHAQLPDDGIITFWTTGDGLIDAIEGVAFGSGDWPMSAERSGFEFPD